MERRSRLTAQTRERIIAAAAELFSHRGARATTMNAVARAADVSPATVGNHFASPDLLIEAVIERLLGELNIPDRTVFAGAETLPERVRALTAAMFGFYERTYRWFYLLGAELADVPAVARADAEFRQAMRVLYADALTGNDDDLLARTTAGLVHPATLSALTEAGLSVDEAVEVVADAIVQRAARR
ncbi:TetR/AcrR family transcriptional regulator [Nocardia sp. GCM10030253]|uniref:TetR/AcrR family transcriptional regulator n=1 Tax=Nocardia sp. GCM10030253 TaxID=3273404 RepID=UPI00362A8CA5